MRKPRLLDLFCKAGGTSMGYHRAGFDVVGVDIEPQPRYPFEFIRWDALKAVAVIGHLFDAVAASPPCQAFSALRVMKNARPHADLLTPVRDALLALGKPFVIENVPGAPMRRDIVLCGSMFGLGLNNGEAQLRRHRWFEVSFPPPLVFSCSHDRRKPIEVYGHGDSGRAYRKYRTVTVVGTQGGSSRRDRAVAYKTHERREAMGIDWMKDHELSQAIPPAYTEFIGKQLMRHIQATS